MSVTQTELRRKQIEQAEELLFSGVQKAGFAKDLFFGRFRAESIFPYPSLPADLEAATRRAVDEVREFYPRSHRRGPHRPRIAHSRRGSPRARAKSACWVCAYRLATAGGVSRSSNIAASWK